MSARFPNPDELPELDEIEDIEDEPISEEEEEPGAVEEAADETPIHHLETICQGCRVRVRLNDMPIADLTADDPDQAEWYAPPVNLFLIGADNMIELTVEPIGEPDDPRDVLDEAELEVAVRVFHKGDAVAPGAGPEVLFSRVHDELRERIRLSREREAEGQEEELEVPQTFFLLFDNEGATFADELADPEPYDDESALRDYAIHLRDLATANDARGLVAEMEPKLQAYARAYDEPRDAFYDDVLEGLRDVFLPLGIQADFERDDVELERCAGGRVWALRRPGRQPLLQTPPGDEGSTKQIEVFVALRDGALRIVR